MVNEVILAHPSWNCVAHILFTAVFTSRGGHSHICCSHVRGCTSKFWPSVWALDLFDHTQIGCLTTASTTAVHYTVIIESTVWPLDEPVGKSFDLLTLVSSTSWFLTSFWPQLRPWIKVCIWKWPSLFVSWEAPLLVACYSIQLFNSGAHRFVWCSYAKKDNPHRSKGSTLEHLLQNWTVVRK